MRLLSPRDIVCAHYQVILNPMNEPLIHIELIKMFRMFGMNGFRHRILGMIVFYVLGQSYASGINNDHALNST